MLILRPYQQELKPKVYDEWNNGHKNVLLVKPTGMGKTKFFSSVTIDLALNAANKLPTAILVHRKELVQQISLTLAEEGIVHNIIAPRPVITGIVAAHRRLLNKQFYSYQSNITVVSVDTLNARILKHEKWAKSIRFWITDEAAHLLKNNKWGRAVEYFPNAIGLGVTATPQRLDKKGLGRHADGVFDVMVEGPSTRWGIANGYLCNYKIAIPQSDYQNYLRKASEGSDWSKEAMTIASERSTIVGDVVTNYKKFAMGKQAIVFTTDVGTGKKLEAKFISEGIKAKFLSSDSGDKERLDAMIEYKDKKIQVLINVDLFDEGLDVPGIDVVSMARPTMSVGKFLQMVGRGLRPVYAPGFDLSTVEGRLASIAASSKPFLTLIDHVGNVTGGANHGLPDAKRYWTLDRIVKKRDKTNFIRICSNIECNAPYDRTLSECPWCGTVAFVNKRSEGGGKIPPKEVDGDLELIDPETLRELEANARLPDPELIRRRVTHKVNARAGAKAYLEQVERINTQKDLVNVIAKWAGIQRSRGYSDRAIHKKFYLEHDKTITEALGEPRAQMQMSIEKLTWEVDA